MGAAGGIAGAKGLSVAYDATGPAGGNGVTVERDEVDGSIAVAVPGQGQDATADEADAQPATDASVISYTGADGQTETRATFAFECDLGTFEC